MGGCVGSTSASDGPALVFHTARDAKVPKSSFTLADSIYATIPTQLDIGSANVHIFVDNKPYDKEEGYLASIQLFADGHSDGMPWETIPISVPSGEVIDYYAKKDYSNFVALGRWNSKFNLECPPNICKMITDEFDKFGKKTYTIRIELRGLYNENFLTAGTFKLDCSKKPTGEMLDERYAALKKFVESHRTFPKDAEPVGDSHYHDQLVAGAASDDLIGGTVTIAKVFKRIDTIDKHPATGIPLSRETQAYMFGEDSSGFYVMAMLVMRSTYMGNRWDTPTCATRKGARLISKELYDLALAK